MKLIVSGRKVDISDAFRQVVEDNLKDFCEKHAIDPVDVTVVLSKPTFAFHIDLKVHLGHHLFLRSSAEASDAYACLVQAMDTIVQRLRRYKKRLTDHHKNRDHHIVEKHLVNHFVVDGTSEEEDKGEDNPAVIADTKLEVHRMSVAEAVMRLDLAQENTLIFKNTLNDRLNVVYRRTDGNIGWADPQ